MRRLNISGANLSLMDYYVGRSSPSGGYRRLEAPVRHQRLPAAVADPQQPDRRLVERRWNQISAGVEGAPSEASFPNPPYTTLETTPVSREKPYLFIDGKGKYHVRVPSAQTNTRGISWADGMAEGRTIRSATSSSATPTDSGEAVATNWPAAPSLLLSPGVYDVGKSIVVKRANSVVLGIEHATLTAVDGAVPLTVNDVPGIIIAGVTIDAGTVESPMLLQVGKPRKNCRRATRPTRPRSRACTSASVDRTSARPTSRSRSTATTF